jgi:SP family arabinose:H+ symporter-like MFS transporter
MQQFTGMNIILYYAPKIFNLAGFTSTRQQMFATIIVGLTFVLATFIAIGIVDKSGRKPALKIGFSIIALGTLVLGYCLKQFNAGTANSGLSWLSVGMTMMCIAGYAMSAAPVIWILCSEIQPLKSRDLGITCSTTTNWISNMIIGATFLTLMDSIGPAGTFWLYTLLNLSFVVITFILIPETKNVSLEQIERNLMAGKKLRDIGQ